jgi:putative spermidine/putrescine transport system substrate-binding protein
MNFSRGYSVFKKVAICLLASSMLAPVLAQAADVPAKGNVTVTGFFGPFQDRFTELVIKPFEKKFPGIAVTFKPVKNSAEAMGLLRLQKQDPSVDVAIIDISVALMANKEKIFAPLDAKLVPNQFEIADWGRLPGNMGVALTTDNFAVLYNPKLIKKPPVAWKDLWSPEFKGKLALPIADTRGVVWIPILARMAGKDYKTDIDPAIAQLKALAPSVQTWDPQPDVYTAVRSGSSPISVAWNARGQYTHDISQGDVDVVIPTEGTVSQINTINLVANTPDAAAAQVFINYALSAESQKYFAEGSFYGPTNKKVQLSPEVHRRIYGSVEIQKRTIQLDWAWLADRYSAWVQRIKREVIGG